MTVGEFAMVAEVALVGEEDVHKTVDEAVHDVGPFVNTQLGQFVLVKAPDGPYVRVFYMIIKYFFK